MSFSAQTLRRAAASFAAVAAFLAALPAHAHHAMGGSLPSSFTEGLLSGIGHPIIGLDHFAFVVAVGLAAVMLPHRALMPLAFVAATILGVVVHLAAIDLPFAELLIALSVGLVGALLAAGRSLPPMLWAGLFGIAGLFHGYAYGESIVGAEPTPLVTYFVGFSVVQYAIACGAMLLADRMGRAASSPGLWTRIAGGSIAGIGLVFLTQALLPV